MANKPISSAFLRKSFQNSWTQQMSTWEGVKNKMYLDIYKKPTIGIGHLITKSEQNLLTSILSQEEIINLFMSDSQECFKDVSKVLSNCVDKMSDKQLVAICSLWFNYGPGTFKTLAHVKYLATNGLPNSQQSFEAFTNLYTRPMKNPELVNRRKAEIEIFRQGTTLTA